MGRRRKPRNQKREPITISIPSELVAKFDATLNDDLTRSGAIEILMRRSLKTSSQTTIDQFSRHLYHCLDCHREFHLNRKVDPDILICRGDNGCFNVGGKYIEYIGVLPQEGGEEE